MNRIHEVSEDTSLSSLVFMLSYLVDMDINTLSFTDNRELFNLLLNQLIHTGTNKLIQQHWYPLKPDEYDEIEFIQYLLGNRSEPNFDLQYVYVYIPDKQLHSMMESSPSSWYPFLRYGLSGLYPRTMRAKTYMMKFIQGQTINVDKNLIKSGGVVKVDNHYVIGVTRYSEGMTKGLFSGVSNRKYCGTFYYLEPDSDTVLMFSSYLVYPTKIVAAIDLIEQLLGRSIRLEDIPDRMHIESTQNESEESEVQQSLSPEPFIQKFLYPTQKVLNERDIIAEALIDGIYDSLSHKDIISDIYNMVNPALGIDLKDNMDVNHISRETVFILIGLFKRFAKGESVFTFGSLNNPNLEYPDFMYAMEDPLDQPLCRAGTFFFIDIFILTHMAGISGPVSEILDTRSRLTSFKSLHRIV